MRPPRPACCSASALQQVGAGLLGPVGARLDQAAGGEQADADVGPHHDQAVIALRRLELDVGDLAGLDAGGERQRRGGKEDEGSPTHADTPDEAGAE